MKIREKRTKAVFNWASQQRADRLASLIVCIMNDRQLKMIMEDNGLTLPK